MRSILVSIAALFLGISLLLLGNSLLSTLLILRGVSQGFSEQFLGIMSSVYFLGALMGTWLASHMIRQMGHIRCFTFCASLLACGALLYALLVHPVAWLLVRFVSGFGIFVMFTVIESWLNGQTPGEHRSRVFSLYMLVNLIATAMSQQLLHLDTVQAFTLFAVAAALLSAAIMPVSWTRLQQPNIALDMPKMNLGLLFRSAPVAVSAVIISGFIQGPFWGLTPLFAAGLGYSESQLAMYITLSVLGGAFIQYPVGRLSDRHDRRKVIILALGGAIAVALGMSLAAQLLPGNIVLMTGLTMMFAGLVLAVYPIAVAHLVDRIHRDHLVAGSSGLLLLYGVGSFIGPSLAGFGLQRWGGESLPIYYVGLLALFTALIFWQLKRSHVVEKPADYEGHFVAMVRTSPNVLPLHPDSEEEIEPEERRQSDRETGDSREESRVANQ